MNQNLEGIVKERMEEWAKRWKGAVAIGILLVVLGAVAIGVPVVATLAVEILLGWLFVIAGIVQFVHLFRGHARSGLVLSVLGAILYMIAGVLLLLYPLQGELTLTVVVAVLFLFDGVVKIVAGAQLYRQPGWGWFLFSGVIAAVLGLFIWAELPSAAAWAIGLLVGINFFVTGFMLIAIALQLRSGPPRFRAA